MPPFITVEEDEEELLICLHLPLSETSLAQRTFASSRARSLSQPLRELGLTQPPDSTDEPPSPSLSSVGRFVDPRTVRFQPKKNQDLDLGLVQPRGGPGKETIIAVLDQAIARNKPPLGGVIGGLSRGVANLLFGGGRVTAPTGISMSQLIAELTDSTVAEVHTRLILPFIGEPGLGQDFSKALVDDFRRMARAGDVQGLEGTVQLLSDVAQRVEGIIKSQTSPGAVFGDDPRPTTGAGRGLLVLRSVRARKGVKELKRQAELNLLLAKRVQEAP